MSAEEKDKNGWQLHGKPTSCAKLGITIDQKSTSGMWDMLEIFATNPLTETEHKSVSVSSQETGGRSFHTSNGRITALILLGSDKKDIIEPIPNSATITAERAMQLTFVMPETAPEWIKPGKCTFDISRAILDNKTENKSGEAEFYCKSATFRGVTIVIWHVSSNDADQVESIRKDSDESLVKRLSLITSQNMDRIFK